MSTAMDWFSSGSRGVSGATRVWSTWSPSALILEELVHLLEHLFDAEADGFTFFGEGSDLGLGHGGEGLLLGELGSEGGDFGFGCGAGFAFAFDDLYGA